METKYLADNQDVIVNFYMPDVVNVYLTFEL